MIKLGLGIDEEDPESIMDAEETASSYFPTPGGIPRLEEMSKIEETD